MTIALLLLWLGAGPAAAQTCLESSSSWQSRPFPPGNMAFSAEFDAVPADYGAEALTGLSLGDATRDSGLAVAVRFGASGLIEALDGDRFAADARLRYRPGASYHFALKVDLVLRRYSVTVTAPAEAPRMLAADYAISDEARALTRLDRWALRAASGSHKVCSFASAPGPTDPYGG